MFKTPSSLLFSLCFLLPLTSFPQLSTHCFFFLHLNSFIHLVFIPPIALFGFDWLRRNHEGSASVVGSSVLYLLLHSSRSIAAVNGASECVNAACFPPMTRTKLQNICAHVPSCLRLAFCSERHVRGHVIYRTWRCM